MDSFTTQTKQARYGGGKLLESPLSHMAIWRPAWATWEAILSKPKDNNSKTKLLTKTKTDWDLLWGSRIGKESLGGRLGVRPCSSQKATTKITKPSLSCILFALCVHHIDSQTHLFPFRKEILFPETPSHLPPLNIYGMHIFPPYSPVYWDRTYCAVKLALDLWPSCLGFLSTGTTGGCRSSQFTSK